MLSYCSRCGVLHLPAEYSCSGKAVRDNVVQSANMRTTMSGVTATRMASKSANDDVAVVMDSFSKLSLEENNRNGLEGIAECKDNVTE